MKFPRKSGSSSYLDLTPIVDVVFNLLIFFALSLNFTPAVRGVKINVPSVSSNVEKVKPKRVVISVFSNGRIFLGDRQMSRKALRETLSGAKDKSAIAVIKAEENVAHGTVVEIMALIKSAGYQKFALGAQKQNL